MMPTTHEPLAGPAGCSPWLRRNHATLAAVMSGLPADCHDAPTEPSRTCPPVLDPHPAIVTDEWSGIEEVPAAGAWC